MDVEVTSIEVKDEDTCLDREALETENIGKTGNIETIETIENIENIENTMEIERIGKGIMIIDLILLNRGILDQDQEDQEVLKEGTGINKY